MIRIARKDLRLLRIWDRLSLRKRLLLPIGAMVLCALASGSIALQTFSPNQFEYENEQEVGSSKALAAALNTALSVAQNPEQTLSAFVRGLGDAESIKYRPASSSSERPVVRVDRSAVPAWFVSGLSIPDIGAVYPIKIKDHHVGDILFSPDLSADIWEKWVGFLAIVSLACIPLLLAALTTYLTTGSAIRPLAQLGAGLSRMRNGDYSTPIAVTGPLEIRQGCAEANQLAATVKRLRDDNRELLRRLVSVQDVERRELAREVHDELGPLLFAIRANATALLEPSPKASDEQRAHAHSILAAAEALHGTNRRILEGLSPLYLAELGLCESIRTLLRNAQREKPALQISQRISPDIDSLDSLSAQTTYRVVQEGVTNVLRHARAEAMEVAVTVSGEELLIEIKDDGIGLPETLAFGRGLIGMRERVRALGGALTLSRESSETIVRGRLPLDRIADG